MLVPHHCSAYIEIPKGFFPTGTRASFQGISQAPESIFLRRAMSRTATATGHDILKDRRGPKPVLLSSRPRALNTTLNSGRIQINLKDPAVRGLYAQAVHHAVWSGLTVSGIHLFNAPGTRT